MGKHTKEPWYAYSLLSKGIHAGYQYGIANSKPCGIQQDEDGNWYPDFPDWSSSSRVIAKTTDGEDAKHNAVRIVACVNALAGIENPEAMIEKVRELRTWWLDFRSEAHDSDPSVLKIVDDLVAILPKDTQ